MFSSELSISFASHDKLQYQTQENDHSKPSYLENGVYDAAKDNHELCGSYWIYLKQLKEFVRTSEKMIKAFNITKISGSQNLFQNFNTYSVVELDLLQLVNMLKYWKFQIK